MLINQQKCNDISAVGRINDRAYRISKVMTRLPQHERYLREDDGAMNSESVSPVFYREHPEVQELDETDAARPLEERKR